MTKLISINFLVVLFLFGIGSITTLQAQDSTGREGTITITEYSDYQCPTCARYHPVVEKLKDHFGKKIDVKYRFFPLQIHQYVAMAARAAQAARNQGKFKQMHDLLFENQKRWANSANPTPVFVSYARKIGLNIDRFKKRLKCR